VPEEVYKAYEQRIFNLLKDEYRQEIITLSAEADSLMEEFSQELEPKLVKEYAEIADWCGKLAGNVLRIAGLLCRANVHRSEEFLDEPEPLVMDGETMENAIKLGKYFLNHAQAIFNVLPENAMFHNANRILKMITEKGLTEAGKKNANTKAKTATDFAFQVNPIALRVGNDHIGGFLEAGLGYKGFVTAGMSLKF